jgi:putative SOS response-associated peptidase YedK
MRGLFGIAGPLPNLPARYNVAPTQDVPIVRFNPETHERSRPSPNAGLDPIAPCRASVGYKLINARVEGIDSKPSFRSAFKSRRCLIPADGFYEWQRTPQGKQPYMIRLKGGSLFAMAGLWENWKNPEGQWVRTCTIITGEPNEVAAPIHNRMPVILERGDYGMWLGEAAAEPRDLLALLKPYPAERMEAYRIGTAVNNVRNDDPSLVERVA